MGWYSGWDNSFNKGYEQYYVGMSFSWAGVVLFIAAMMYVPMAQARQAATGEWRRFYDFGLVWGLVRRRWMACVGLAALFSLFSMGVFGLKVAPLSFEITLENYYEMSDGEVLAFMQMFTFWMAVALLPLFLLLRLIAGRIYAGAVVKGLRDGRVPAERLGGFERHVLDRLDMLAEGERVERHVIVRAAGGAMNVAGRFAAGLAMVLIWFSLAAQMHVTAFLNYHEAHEWLNQPMVQLPWVNYIPQRTIDDAMEEEGEGRGVAEVTAGE